MDSSRALQILQLHNNASLDDIKKAYRQIAKECHPDKFSDPKEKNQAEDRIKEVNEAYNLLKYVWERKSNSCEQVSDASNLNPICVTSTPKGCEFFYERAKQRENNGQDLEALKDCNQAIRINPDYLVAYQLRRFICLKLGYENRARSDDRNIQQLQQKSNKSKRYDGAVKNRSSSSEKSSRPSDQPPIKSSQSPHQAENYHYSIDDYSTDSNTISDPSIFYKRAQHNLKLGRVQEAIENCHKALELNADYIEAYRLRRMLYLRLGQQAEAALDMQEINRLDLSNQFQSAKSGVSQSEKSNSIEPEIKSSNDPSSFYEQAIHNFEKGKYQDALTNCNRSIRLNPDYLEVYKLRRKICMILGYKDRVSFDTKQINRIESNISQANNLNQENP